jgi:hypothetical protein
MGRFPSITHPFAARRQDCSRVTARLACVKHAASVQSEPGSNSSLKGIELLSMSKSKAHCWTFGHSVFAPKASTQVPTQVICQIIKERRGRNGPKQGAGSIALGHIPSTTEPRDYPTRNRRAAPGSGAAQYSDHSTVVNAAQHERAYGKIAVGLPYPEACFTRALCGQLRRTEVVRRGRVRRMAMTLAQQ